MVRIQIAAMFAVLLLGEVCLAQDNPDKPKVFTGPKEWKAFSAEARKTGKPCFVWVNYKCMSSVNRMPGTLHYFHKGDWTTGAKVTGQAVIAYKAAPEKGYWYRYAVIDASDCCRNSLMAPFEGRTTPRRSRRGGGRWFAGG